MCSETEASDDEFCAPQERGIRSGTVPAPLAVGLGAACDIAQREMEFDKQHITRLARRLHKGITSQANLRLLCCDHVASRGLIWSSDRDSDGSAWTHVLHCQGISSHEKDCICT